MIGLRLQINWRLASDVKCEILLVLGISFVLKEEYGDKVTIFLKHLESNSTASVKRFKIKITVPPMRF